MSRRSRWYWLPLIVASCIPARAQSTGATIPVPDTIRAEGVPPIPASLGEALNRYQNIRSATYQDWASDGSGMYIITRFADVPQVHFVEKAGGARTQLTFLNDRVLSVHDRPKHDQFLYVADEGGAENYQLFLQDRKTGQARRITDGKSRNMAPKWSPSGELLAWSSNSRNGRDMDLYVASPLDPHFTRRFKEVSGQWTVSDWSPDETRVVAVEYVSINESYIHTIDLATGNTERITQRRGNPNADRVFAGDAKWSKDGRSIYFITDSQGEFRQLVQFTIGSGRVRVLTGRSPGDVEDYDISPDGNFIALAFNEKGISRAQVIDSNTGELKGNGSRLEGLSPPRAMLILANGQIDGIKFRPGSWEVGLTYNTSDDAVDAYAAQLFQGELTRWTQSEAGGLDPSAFAQAERIEYHSFDDHKIPALIYRPSPQKFPGARPVLIDIHGGPEGQSRPVFIGRLNYLVNELGIVLICPNVRGSSGYGKTYLKLDNGKLRADAVKDIGALLDWIATQEDLDKSRVGVTGGSYGGFMSLAVQTTYNDRIRAGIDVVGISNFVSFLKNTRGYRRDLRRAEYGDERDPEMRRFLEQVSPLTNARKIHTPILIVQGQNDPRVPLSESEQMVAAVRKNNVPVWYVVGKNEGHGFAKKANQDYLQAVEVEFLRRYLLAPAEQQAENVPPRCTVRGTVHLDGKPLDAAVIVFTPVVPKGRKARGEVKDGKFHLTTIEADDGALPGDYKVTIEPSDNAHPPKNPAIPARYSNPETTSLRAGVRPAVTVLDFRIQSDKPAPKGD